MATKRQIAEAIILNKSGGNISDTKIQPRDLYVYIEMAINEAIGVYAAKQRLSAENVTAFTKTYTGEELAFYYDETRDETFIIAPVDFGESGLVQVRPPQGPAMAIQKIGQATIYNELEAGEIENGVVYCEGHKIYLKDSGKIDCCEMAVTVRPNASSYDEDEEIDIPEGMGVIFIDRVMALAEGNRVFKYKDTNDQNKNQ